MTVDLEFLIKLSSIVLLGLGFLYLSILTLWDRYIRLKTINYLGVGFFFIALGILVHLIRLANPTLHFIIVSIAASSNALGLLFVWIHFQLMSKQMLSMVAFSVLIIILSFGLTLLVLNVAIFSSPILTAGAMASLVIISFFMLISPIKMGFHDFLRNNDIRALAEGGSFFGLLLAILGFVVHYYTQVPTVSWLSNLIMIVSAGGLIILYTWNPRLMYRIPFKIWYLLGFHDSGLFFFKKKLEVPVPNSSATADRRMQYLSSMFTAIDAIFKHILEQDVIVTIQKSPYLEILFKRDPQKKLGYIIIAERHSYYLEQALQALLRLTPSNLLLTNPNDEHSVLIDHECINTVLIPLILEIFPNIFRHDYMNN